MSDKYLRECTWVRRAACVGKPPALFSSEELSTPGQPRNGTISAAKAVCSVCPVTRECLSYAVDNREDYGIWGGLTGAEREQLRRTTASRNYRVGHPTSNGRGERAQGTKTQLPKGHPS